MKYISTRDQSKENTPRKFSFLDAVLEGLAPDGGLLVPEYVPKISSEKLKEWKLLNYQDLCLEVLSCFVDEPEIPTSDLRTMISNAYSTFPQEVVPLVSLKNSEIQILELFHGPTFAFKDVALQLLGQLFDYALNKRNTRMTILGATSGDTGSAAICGVKGRKNIDCVIMFPLRKTSHVQELQMTSNLDSNIHCLAVRDSCFDDCQTIVKECFGDEKLNSSVKLGAVNSINWARILAQVVYYCYASLRVPDSATFVVPTGNFGNILAGYYAKMMGLPINKLVIASNSNDILPRFFETGIYRIAGPVVPTMSPSMDIAVSSNFERFLFDLLNRDGRRISEKFFELKHNREFHIGKEELETARKSFIAFSESEDVTLKTIFNVYSKSNGYLLCPHSAVGYAAAEQYIKNRNSNEDSETIIALATAHIGKFTQNILENAKQNFHSEADFIKAIKSCIPEKLRALEHATTRRIDIGNNIDSVKGYLWEHVHQH